MANGLPALQDGSLTVAIGQESFADNFMLWVKNCQSPAEQFLRLEL